MEHLIVMHTDVASVFPGILHNTIASKLGWNAVYKL